MYVRTGCVKPNIHLHLFLQNIWNISNIKRTVQKDRQMLERRQEKNKSSRKPGGVAERARFCTGKRPRRAVSSLIPPTESSAERLALSPPARELQCLRAQEAEMLQTGSGCRQLVWKVFKVQKSPSVAITESGVSGRTNEGSWRRSRDAGWRRADTPLRGKWHRMIKFCSVKSC